MKVMLTGATGFIGSWTIPALTSAGHDVIALIRRPAQAAALSDLVAERGGDPDRLSCVVGDLSQPGLGLTESVDPDVIVHLGASFAWNLDPEVARATNVDGSLEVVRLAARHHARLVLIGGYMLTNQTHLGELGIDLGRPDDVDWAAVAVEDRRLRGEQDRESCAGGGSRKRAGRGLAGHPPGNLVRAQHHRRASPQDNRCTTSSQR